MSSSASSNSLDFFRSKLEKRKQQRIELLKDLSLLKQDLDSFNKSNDSSLGNDLKFEIESFLIEFLEDPLNDLPISSDRLAAELGKSFDHEIAYCDLERIVQKLNDFECVKIEHSLDPTVDILTDPHFRQSAKRLFHVVDVDPDKLNVYKRRRDLKRDDESDDGEEEVGSRFKKAKSIYNHLAKQNYRVSFSSNPNEVIEKIIAKPTSLELDARQSDDELNELLTKETALFKLKADEYKCAKSHVREYCRYLTRDECNKAHYQATRSPKCEKIHFKRVIKAHTDVSQGDCSFLNTCFHMETCKYIHYEIDEPESSLAESQRQHLAVKVLKPEQPVRKIPPQWVNCDLRKFDMRVLGKFSVIMADPPWDIHMELPYGTMADEEMRRLDIPSLQDDGYIFLWVTGRAMELGRECLKIWGYERCDELIWVKTNQLQRIIRTGRTGHWLNHGKEHCLIGAKGKPDPKMFNTMIDCDILVAEVRATSHKPDEIYGLIERLAPGARKVELFGRPHNVQPNWVTLGNQLDGTRLIEPDVVKRYKERYPNGHDEKANNSTNDTSNNQQSISNNQHQTMSI